MDGSYTGVVAAVDEGRTTGGGVDEEVDERVGVVAEGDAGVLTDRGVVAGGNHGGGTLRM